MRYLFALLMFVLVWEQSFGQVIHDGQWLENYRQLEFMGPIGVQGVTVRCSYTNKPDSFFNLRTGHRNLRFQDRRRIRQGTKVLFYQLELPDGTLTPVKAVYLPLTGDDTALTTELPMLFGNSCVERTR